MLLIISLLALLAEWIAPYGCDDQDFEASLMPPSRAHLLGTDQLGRDIFSRLLYGARVSLAIALIGLIVSGLTGIVLGGVAGYFGGWLDAIIMRSSEILLALPSLYFLMALRAALPLSLSFFRTVVMIASLLALLGWVGLARVVRSRALSLRESDFVLAARLLGASDFYIIRRHIIGQMGGLILVLLTNALPYFILGEVALSYLGLGISEPKSSLGLMFRDALNLQVLTRSWWLMTPGFYLVWLVLGANLLSDGLRQMAEER
jgi:peptide/nickel transport system permease protein